MNEAWHRWDMSITNIVPPSATLAVNERLRRLIEAGRPILHLAFGEAGLPVPDEVLDALRSGGPDNGYGPVAGSIQSRTAAAAWFDRLYRHEPNLMKVIVQP